MSVTCVVKLGITFMQPNKPAVVSARTRKNDAFHPIWLAKTSPSGTPATDDNGNDIASKPIAEPRFSLGKISATME